MENDGIPSGEPAPLDPIHGSSAIYDSHGYMIGVLDNNRDVGSNNASTSNDVNMASETDIVPSNDTRRRDDVNGHVVSIDFDGKQVHLADIIEADNSVRYNMSSSMAPSGAARMPLMVVAKAGEAEQQSTTRERQGREIFMIHSDMMRYK